MRRYGRFTLFFLIFALTLLPSPSAGEPAEAPTAVLNAIRYRPDQDSLRIVLELSGPAAFADRHLRNPDRIYIDLDHTSVANPIAPIETGDGIVKMIRSGQHDKETVRVVIDLDSAVDYKVFPLTSPDRVVIDIFKKTPAARRPDVSVLRTIVIDPGHGGKDPGAIGRHKLMEKEIVLDVGLRLKRLIKEKLGVHVIMTREEDIFIPLEERTAIANAKDADLFISIHTNSSRKKEAKGVETYLLGRATDKGAMDAALRENSAPRNKSMDDLQFILTDLMTTARKDESLRLAHYVQTNLIEKLEPRYKSVDHGVKQAPFYVLVNAKMPSILAEISFISNPEEERLLAGGGYRQVIAEAIFEGIKKYVQSTSMLAHPGEAANTLIRR